MHMLQVQSMLGLHKLVLKLRQPFSVKMGLLNLYRTQLHILRHINHKRAGDERNAFVYFENMCKCFLEEGRHGYYYEQLQQGYFSLKMCYEYGVFRTGRQIATKMKHIIS